MQKKTEIHFSDLAGREIYEFTGTGFWYKLHRSQIPNARYIKYDDFMVFTNVIKSKNVLTFVTELGNTMRIGQEDCVVLPITDATATAHYRLAFLRNNKTVLQNIIQWVCSVSGSW